MTEPLGRQMPCCACDHESHIFVCERCGCTCPVPGSPEVLP